MISAVSLATDNMVSLGLTIGCRFDIDTCKAKGCV
jgi:hypothetical protein